MRGTAAILVLSCLPLGAVCANDVYRSVDAQGHVQYSDTPSPGAELIHVSASATSSSSSTQSASLAKTSQQISTNLTKSSTAQATQQDVAQSREEQCKQATDAYQKSVEAHRISKTDDKGNITYLTGDDAEAERVKFREAMQAACGTTP